MVRAYGRAPRGHRKTTTFIAALRQDAITAPCVIDGPINGEPFLADVEQFLVPILAPDDIVIMDNLGSHKGDAVRRAVAAVKATLLFLPPYSPDLGRPLTSANRAGLRQAQGAAAPGRRPSIPTPWNAVGALLSGFTAAECANHFADAGYVLPNRNPLYVAAMPSLADAICARLYIGEQRLSGEPACRSE